MKISQLVNLKHKLKGLSVLAATEVTNAATKLKFDADLIDQSIFVFPFTDNIDVAAQELIKTVQSIETNVSKINQLISTTINEIDKEINNLAKQYFTSGYIINDFPAPVDVSIHNEHEIRVLPIDEGTKAVVMNIARGYTNWHYPTLEIGPGHGEWTEHLIAGDPLYIVDIQQDYIDSTLSKFNEVYKRRVRPYIVKRGSGDNFADLSRLPQEQFGFIFSWNVFNYFPLTELTSYLRESFKLLRSGGIMMFSYNNCDSPICAYNVEVGLKSWMTEQLLIETCKDLGFEIINTQSVSGSEEVHWIEIKKPGKLKTVKAHQVLGKITPIGT
jgi:phospholipid N-methyltransferase